MDFDTRVGAYAVIVREGHVLLTHWTVAHLPPEARPGLQAGWTLPGGGLEFSEDPATAAIREVEEETGFVVRLQSLLGTHSLHLTREQRQPGRPPRALHSLRVIYEGMIVAGDLRVEVGGSTDDARWVPLEEVSELHRVDLVDAALGLWQRSRATSAEARQRKA